MVGATHNTAQVYRDFAFVREQPDEEKRVRLVGRIVSRRAVGKSGYLHLQDEKDYIQVYVNIANVGDAPYKLYRGCEMGSIIAVTGVVYRTPKLQVITVRADAFEVVHHMENQDHVIYTRRELRPQKPIEVVFQDNGTFNYIADDGAVWTRSVPSGSETLWAQDVVFDARIVAMRTKSSPRLAEDELSNQGPGEEESTCATQ